MRLLVVPSDPLCAYLSKGEIKQNYWNPGNIFKHIDIIDFTEKSVRNEDIQVLAGNAILKIHELKPRKFFLMPFFYCKIKRILINVKPDIIRIHAYRHIGVVVIFAANELKIPVVVSVHSEGDDARLHETSIKWKLAKSAEKYSFSNAVSILSMTNALHPYIKKYGGKNIITIYNKVDTSRFINKTHFELFEPNKLNILSVMRLDIQKDPFTLLQAVKLTLFSHLTIVGYGSQEMIVDKMIKELQIEERVTIIKSIPNKDIPMTYIKADIFAMSTKFEGFCIPILEAMASGLPIVSSNTLPIPEVLGDTGILIERDPLAFSKAFIDFYQNIELRKILGTKARERAVQLDAKVWEQKEIDFYYNITNSLL
jgi:glycosyltransferase involved in cell wall biosynthesis